MLIYSYADFKEPEGELPVCSTAGCVALNHKLNQQAWQAYCCDLLLVINASYNHPGPEDSHITIRVVRGERNIIAMNRYMALKAEVPAQEDGQTHHHIPVHPLLGSLMDGIEERGPGTATELSGSGIRFAFMCRGSLGPVEGF